jgi:phenylalanyl-tRNA synthetase beta chain
MKVPVSWIGEYTAVGDPDEVAATLTRAGIEIEDREGEVLELGISANRADLLSVLGVARELAVHQGTTVKAPEISGVKGEPVDVEVSVEAPDLCDRYTARLIEGVKVGESPGWMKERLEAAGVRAVNNIVDITNYVLLESGQPLHAFDMDLLTGDRIVVRRGRGEKMTAIDGREYELTPEMLVIADGEVPVAIAGVMGGKGTEIHGGTTNILLESASFDRISVRRASRKLRLVSESSYRFERGVDWATVDWASHRAAQLMAELAGGTVRAGGADVSKPAPVVSPIRFRPERVSRVLGMEIPPARIDAILRGIGCTKNDAGEIVPPATRRDLREEIDLIEEVVRVEGYDRLPSDTALQTRVVTDQPVDLVRQEVRSLLMGMGCFEVVTWSFEGKKYPSVDENIWSSGKPLGLRDPEGNVDRFLRKSLRPGLIEVLETNLNYREEPAPVFELGTVYHDSDAGFGERKVLSVATPHGYADLKGRMEQVLSRMGVTAGEVSLRMDAVEEIPGGAAGELDFDELVSRSNAGRKFSDFSRTPPVKRDLAIVLKEEVSWKEVEATIRGTGIGTLGEIAFLDLYRGRQVPPGHKSLALGMTFRASGRTLTSGEVDRAVENVVTALGEKLGGALRT